MAGSDVQIKLVCVECRKEADGRAPGWRLHLTVDDEVAMYCPDCNRREFCDASLSNVEASTPLPAGSGFSGATSTAPAAASQGSQAGAKPAAGSRTSSGSGCGEKRPLRHR